jgi:molybdopterin-binding protein
MKISARNQFPGKVIEVKEGSVNAIVKMDIGNGIVMTSVITMDALNDLGIKVGASVTAFVKSSSVMIMA